MLLHLLLLLLLLLHQKITIVTSLLPSYPGDEPSCFLSHELVVKETGTPGVLGEELFKILFAFGWSI